MAAVAPASPPRQQVPQLVFSGRPGLCAHFALPTLGLELAVIALLVVILYLYQRRRFAEQHAQELAHLNETIRRSQEALRQSEERFRRAFEDGPVGIILASPDSRILRANRALCRLLGYAEGELLGFGLMDIVYPEDANRHLEHAQRLFRGEISQYQLEQRYVTRQKETIWAKVTTSLLTSANGTPLYELSIVEDITVRKRSEETLRQLEERFSKAFHGSPVPITIATLAEGRFIEVNDSFLHLAGYRRDELVGRTALELGLWLEPSERQTVVQRLQGGGSIRQSEGKLRTKAGDVRECLGAAELIELNGERCILSLLQDVTERKRADEELRKSEERFQLIARATNDTVWDWDLVTNRIWWNEGIKTVFGYAGEQVVSEANWWDQHIHPEEFTRIVAGMRNVIDSGGRFWSAEYRFRRADGSYAEVFDRAYVIHDPEGRPVRMIGAMMDITERKRSEKELAKARDEALEALRLKSEFLANISHEVRTPLNGIVGMTVLLDDSELNREQRTYVETIQSSSEALLAIINDILDFSKMEAGKLNFETLDFDLRNTVESTMEILADRAQNKQIELICLVNADVPTQLRGDPGRLRQVITNLVVNAIKFTERGEVVLEVAREGETDAHVVLCFTVRDTGIGIPEEALPYLFQAFSQVDGSTTRKYGGTGLGLTISKQIVELMGGQIGVESTQGVGSTFWFTVRLEKRPGSPTTPSVPLPSFAGSRVLVADDNEASRKQLLSCAESLGLDAATATSGKEALQALRDAAAGQRPFTLAILDMEMADLDGLSLARLIKAEPALAPTRLLLISARGFRGDTTVLRATGVGAILPKPVRQKNLMDCLTRLLSATPQHETRFWLDRRASPGESPLLKRGAYPGYSRVLVAEDNPINQRVAVALLEKLGYQAQTVATGTEVLRAMETVAYDIVLMDCQLPEMDGFETTREIRRRENRNPQGQNRPVYIIAMTAFALRGAREQCLAAGMDDYIAKPVRLEALREAMQKATGQSPAQTAPGPPQPAVPVSSAVDPAALDALRALRNPGRPDPVAEMAGVFLRDTPGCLQAIETAITRYDAIGIDSAAHRLRGCASTIGAHRLADWCAQLEAQSRSGSMQVASHLLSQLRAEFGRVCEELKSLPTT